jgi:hypothetical protein
MIGGHGQWATQSRQSAKPFLQSSELGLPQPLTRRRVCTLPFGSGGEGHTRWQERGWESPYSNDGTYTVVLFIYKYFVVDTVDTVGIATSQQGVEHAS